MEQGLVHKGITLEALGDTAKTVEPGKEAFDYPAVGGKFPVDMGTIFEFSVIRRSSQGNAVADTTPNQREPKGLAVVAPIGGQAAGTAARSSSSSGDFDLSQSQRRSRDVGHIACGQMTG
jgi:hypothetical protein